MPTRRRPPTDPTLADARQRYFDANGFSEAAYAERWVTIPLGRLNVRLPSTAGRRRAIPLHDLHHVATGYDTSLIGEAEVGAWELAAGCHDHHAAWSTTAWRWRPGSCWRPAGCSRRGGAGGARRRCTRGEYSPALLQLRLSELRARLGV
jgi:hypothetical protein